MSVSLSALLLCVLPVVSEASVVISAEMPPTYVQGVQLAVVGGGGVCFADGTCAIFTAR